MPNTAPVPRPVRAEARRKRLYDSKSFAAAFHDEGPLGFAYTPDATAFALWAPTALAVTLYLYDDGTAGKARLIQPLDRAAHGRWQCTVPGDLDGTYYDFTVTDAEGTTRRTADPWARACGRDGARSMVLDLRRTDPENWAADTAPAHAPEDIIYELHVRDFSHDASSGVPEALRGTYKALTLTGTTLFMMAYTRPGSTISNGSG